ncbi:MAG: glycosyltransferase family 4 protein [Acidobacteria bacterium]|nr:glycosyltransferase family 4 protein [Acidobacteriota bacterium]MCA1610311.1 glycosyltransferase family 4 protein [Acidobacteriota bacterium]
MRVLMFGWEYPPHVTGGLGVASAGLVGGLLETGTEVILVLPCHPFAAGHPLLAIVDSGEVAAADDRPHRKRFLLRLRRVPSLLRPYVTETSYQEDFVAARETGTTFRSLYGPDLATEVLRYAEVAGRIARRERFDVIHAHDWLTYLAGIEARRASGKPLAVHVHATEFDRSPMGGNAFVSETERLGVSTADRVIAVSRYTADTVSERYGVPRERMRVVHNAIDAHESVGAWEVSEHDPLVLFAGRITWQKGPQFFVDAAALVAREIPNVRFAVAGSGDRLRPMMDRVAAHGIERHFLFTGFLPPAELDRLYARANVYVMPSVSEPFGLTALEALRHGTPAIVSRNAGVSEVVRNVLRVDFGDTNDLASKILSVLLFRPLSDALGAGGRSEVARLSWKDAALKCLEVYRELSVER